MSNNTIGLDNSLLQKYNVKYYGSDYDIYDIIDDFLQDNVSEKAFYIVDLSEIHRAWIQWNSLMPNVQPYYAIKCNPNPVILETLASLGANFDCASENEIKQVMEIVNDPERIIFANPCKMTSQIRYARANDVDMMTFDCEEELYKIKLYHPYAKLVLRLAVDDSFSACRFNKKFGCCLEQVEAILRIAKALSLNVIGFSFHVGSNCSSPEAFYNAIKDCRDACDIAYKMGIKISLIDIGGGFPGDNKVKFESIAKKINSGISDYFYVNNKRMFEDESSNETSSEISEDDKNLDNDEEFENENFKDSLDLQNEDSVSKYKKNFETLSQTSHLSEDSKYIEFLKAIKFISEPGRYFVQSSHTLVLNVIGKKCSINKDNNEKCFIYYLNDGMYGSFNCILFDHYNPKVSPFNERDGIRYKSILFGPTCDSMDTICEDLQLPELAIGEWIYVENFGAYTLAAASAFNGFKTSDYKYIVRS